MIFYRIYDNVIYEVSDKNTIGFPLTDASYIPDSYLEQQEFVVMRTAHGIGDWGILSAMPRLLKLNTLTVKFTYHQRSYLLNYLENRIKMRILHLIITLTLMVLLITLKVRYFTINIVFLMMLT